MYIQKLEKLSVHQLCFMYSRTLSLWRDPTSATSCVSVIMVLDGFCLWLLVPRDWPASWSFTFSPQTSLLAWTSDLKRHRGHLDPPHPTPPAGDPICCCKINVDTTAGQKQPNNLMFSQFVLRLKINPLKWHLINRLFTINVCIRCHSCSFHNKKVAQSWMYMEKPVPTNQSRANCGRCGPFPFFFFFFFF